MKEFTAISAAARRLYGIRRCVLHDVNASTVPALSCDQPSALRGPAVRLRWTSSSEIAAGVTPGTRAAWPSVAGPHFAAAAAALRSTARAPARSRCRRAGASLRAGADARSRPAAGRCSRVYFACTSTCSCTCSTRRSSASAARIHSGLLDGIDRGQRCVGHLRPAQQIERVRLARQRRAEQLGGTRSAR